MDLNKHIRVVKDFPVEGIVFRDITTLLKDAEAFKAAIDMMADTVKDKQIDLIVGIEARGFILGSALAYKLGCGFSPLRKPGKLPYKTVSEEYDLEYGKNKLEMHVDAVDKGQKILIADDLLATGGTAAAAAKMIEKLGAKIEGFLFLIELQDLKGREKLSGYDVYSIVKY